MPDKWVALSAATIQRLVLDAGALYRNYGEAQGEELIGATRGGSTFTVEKEDRMPEIDGVPGPVKGLKRPINHVARLETTLVEISLTTFLDLTRGTAVSDGTHYTITPENDITLSDYYTNIALVAEVANQGDPCVLKILNALSDGEWTITVDDEDEGTLDVTFMGHYDSATADTPPYELMWPVGAS